MKFAFLLFLLAMKLKSAAQKKPNFRMKIKQRNITGVIQTADNRRARSFTIASGQLTSRRGIADQPDFALVWSDAATGYRVMASGSNDVFIKSIADNQLKIEGNGMHALWFLQLTQDMNY